MYDENGRFVFRLKNEEEHARRAKVKPGEFLADTVVEGEPHLALVVPLVVAILAGLYASLAWVGIWPHEFTYLGQCVLTAMKGGALGCVLVGGALRWSPQGRTVKQRIKKKTATQTDQRARLLAQLSFAFGAYFFVGVTFFEFFPHMTQGAPISVWLRLGRHAGELAKQEKLWKAYERWATAPAAGAQILRPMRLVQAWKAYIAA
ncbi:unnamed protein product [Tilletia controversa]|nr:hypothetical protein CF336_g7371 [Tilletia laevis]CAD6946664.1 unnamed protein product [Tilletia controversa]